MASVITNKACDLIADWLATKDLRAILLNATSSVDTENDGIATISDYTTLGESDDNGYSRQALANEAGNLDDANDRAELDADDVTFTLDGDGTGTNYVGVLIYEHVTNDADSIPLFFIEFGSTIALTAVEISVPWDAQGILQVAQAA